MCFGEYLDLGPKRLTITSVKRKGLRCLRPTKCDICMLNRTWIWTLMAESALHCIEICRRHLRSGQADEWQMGRSQSLSSPVLQPQPWAGWRVLWCTNLTPTADSDVPEQREPSEGTVARPGIVVVIVRKSYDGCHWISLYHHDLDISIFATFYSIVSKPLSFAEGHAV